jgi:hypothetical protein
MGALVIKAWRADAASVDEMSNHVKIAGRQGGLIAWALSLLGIDPTTTVQVDSERIKFSNASLAGSESRLIPLQSICSTYYGYHKPWKTAFMFVLLFIFLGATLGSGAAESGSAAGALATLVVTTAIGVVVALAYYFLNRTLTLGFVEISGAVSGIRFKRSVIENVDINEEQAKSVCAVVQQLIDAKIKRASQSVDR